MFHTKTLIIFAMFFISDTTLSRSRLTLNNAPEDGRLNFTQLTNKYGLKAEEFDVITEDGYILKLFRIPGDKSRPVLLMHGLFDSADSFIVRGHKSLAVSLAKAGYEVWAGNCRGNYYSRRHTYLNPDTDRRFWDFTFHEMGYYDLPAFIDFIYNRNAVQVSCVGHSQGNTIAYVLGSTRPEYNQKIKVYVALAPVCFFNHSKPPISTLFETWPKFYNLLEVLGYSELFGNKSLERAIADLVCTNNLSYKYCAYEFLFELGGHDHGELDQNYFYTFISHWPTGASKKNVLHFSQIFLKKNFAQFDHGPAKNLLLYNSSETLKYDLSKVTMPVALFAGKNDRLSELEDVDILRRALPNVVEYVEMKSRLFNHIDYMHGVTLAPFVGMRLHAVLSKYNPTRS